FLSHREPTGAGGIGAPSRSDLTGRDGLAGLASLADLFFASFPVSAPGFCDSPGFFDGGTGVKEAGFGATSGAALADGRGQEDSSARPFGAATGSPRLRTFAAVGSERTGLVWPPAPTRSPLSASFAVRGKTGPTSGRAPTVPDFGAASGAGSATGATWVDITRRS